MSGLQTILVPGGAGFIGRHLVRRLLLEQRVVITDNLSTGKNIPKHPNLILYKEDIRNRETIADIVKRERVDTCIHLAAKTGVTQSLLASNDVMDVNINGTASILEACSSGNVDRFIFASSAAIYGESKTQPVQEDQELRPISSYGESKVAGENLVASYQESGKIPYTISLRFFNIYGEGQNPDYAGVITRFAERLSKGLPLVIYGNGKQTRDFISVEDVVDAIMLAIQSDISETFNIGTGKATVIEELAKKMIEISGLDTKPIYVQSNKQEILYSCANTRKANNILHFQAKRDIYSDLGLLIDAE